MISSYKPFKMSNYHLTQFLLLVLSKIENYNNYIITKLYNYYSNMSNLRFIRLNKYIINPRFIEHIEIKENVYMISLTINSINGISLFNSGWINSSVKEFRICSNNDPEDYKTITKWLDENTFKNE
jgi:hypothetical protein